MKYIINDKVIYDENAQTLSRDNTTISLTLPCSQLLSVFIKKQNTIISRDYLLEKVWGNLGRVSSNHNLSQNIFLLRKNLSELGLEKIIETVPKQGFKFIASATIENSPPKTSAPKIEAKFKIKKRYLLALLGIALLFIAIYFYSSKSYNTVVVKSLEIERCDIFLRKKISNEQRFLKEMEKNTQNIAERCKNKNGIILYDDSETIGKNGFYESILSWCKKDENENIYECENNVYLHVR
ncbi:winged helix-turn-helix domain-containing protein [Providencia rettgeri]